MKTLRYLILAVLILGISGAAHAFQTTVLDPTTTDSPFFIMQPGDSFSFSYANCSVWYDHVHYAGCAVGFNDSNQTITALDMGFDNALDSEDITCTSNAFSDISCGLNSNQTEYVLSFEDGCGSDSCGILPFHFAVFLENAVNGSDFPDVDGTANVVATPEPASIWLALSGLGSAGFLIRRRRKNPGV
jgi:PEP-CTERM motif